MLNILQGSKKHWPELCISSIAIIFCLLYLRVSPSTTPPDEIGHLAYSRMVFLDHSWPAYRLPNASMESHQPPLYYAVSLPFVAAAWSLPFPVQVTINRLTSVLFLLITICIWLYLSKKIFSTDRSARIAMMSGLLLPMSLYLSAAFNNDSAVLCVASLIMIYIIRPPERFTLWGAVGFSAVLALGILTKAQLYPLVGLAFFLRLWKQPWRVRMLVVGSTLLLGGWWFIRNLISVGDLFGLKNAMVWWENQHEPLNNWRIIFTLLTKLAASFVGVFGRMNIQLPAVLYGTTLLALAACIVWAVRHMRHDRRLIVPLAVIIIIIASVLYQNTIFFQPQGRYLFPLLPALSILIGYCIAAQTNQPKRIISISIVGWLILLNSVSLLQIHRYYNLHPVRALAKRHDTEIRDIPWFGDHATFNQTNDAFVLHTPTTVFTAANMELDTQYHPYLTLVEAQGKTFHVQIDWKVLGQSRFITQRRIDAVITGTGSIEIPETEQTLIQDIRLTFPKNDGTISLTSIRGGTRGK